MGEDNQFGAGTFLTATEQRGHAAQRSWETSARSAWPAPCAFKHRL